MLRVTLKELHPLQKGSLSPYSQGEKFCEVQAGSQLKTELAVAACSLYYDLSNSFYFYIQKQIYL